MNTTTIAVDVGAFLDVNPATVHPSANPEQAALLAWAAAHPTPRPAAERTANGRYKLPDPETGKAATWTRATNYASALDDSAGLQTWRDRLLVKGLATDDSLVAYAKAGADINELLSSIAGKALHRAGEKLAADIGTALHTACEHLILGTGERPPDPWGADVDAYAACLDAHGIEIHKSNVERIAITAELGVAGTVDSLVDLCGIEDYFIGDIKTGSRPDRLAYAIQLAIYAHATHLWRLDGEGYEPMPPVDQQTALIFHMPAGSGTCELVEVDIAKGWELAQLCGAVRAARTAKTTKALFSVKETTPCPTKTTSVDADTPVASTTTSPVAGVERPATEKAETPPGATAGSSGPADAETLTARTDWITGRIDHLKANHPERLPVLAERCPADIPRKPPWTNEQIDALDAVLHTVEPSLPPTDPAPSTPVPVDGMQQDAVAETPALWPIDDDGTAASDEDVTGLRAAVKGLADEQRWLLVSWAKQGRDGGRPWDAASGGMTVRCWTIARAAVRCQRAGLGETKTRRALEYVLVEDLHPAWPTGAVLGSLTTAQANELADVADLYAAKDKTVRGVIDARTPAA